MALKRFEEHTDRVFLPAFGTANPAFGARPQLTAIAGLGA
jgi:hypothetical protein